MGAEAESSDPLTAAESSDPLTAAESSNPLTMNLIKQTYC